MSLLHVIAAMLLIAAAISLALSLLGVIVSGALKLLPIVLLVMAVLFFVKGGRIDIHFPGDDD